MEGRNKAESEEEYGTEGIYKVTHASSVHSTHDLVKIHSSFNSHHHVSFRKQVIRTAIPLLPP
jgi:hypothetical protein